ncbi:MAG: hypothetical protein ABI645_00060 [Pseudomonadota bacterium]
MNPAELEHVLSVTEVALLDSWFAAKGLTDDHITVESGARAVAALSSYNAAGQVADERLHLRMNALRSWHMGKVLALRIIRSEAASLPTPI